MIIELLTEESFTYLADWQMIIVCNLWLDVSKSEFFAEFGILIYVQLIQSGLHISKNFLDFLNVQAQLDLLARHIDLSIGFQLVVVEQDALLVFLQQIQDLVQLQQQEYETFELLLLLLFDVEVHKLLLFQLDGLEEDHFLLGSHQNPVEMEDQDRQQGQYLDFDGMDLVSDQILPYFLFQPFYSIFFIACIEAVLHNSSSLEKDDDQIDAFLLVRKRYLLAQLGQFLQRFF